MTRRTALAAVAALTVLGAALRIPALDSGLWFDEIVTLIESVRPPLGDVVTAFPGNNNHPFYSLLAHVAISAFGEHPWTLRLPAVVFGIATIPLVYALGRRVATELEAVLAALLMAVAYHPIWFAQNARGYTMLLAFTLLCTSLVIDLLGRPMKARAIAYGVAAGLGIYTHLTMAFVVAAHALVYGWTIWRASAARRSDLLRPAASGLVIAAVIAGLLYVPMAGEVYDFFSGPPQGTAAVATSSWAAVEMIRGLLVGFGGLGLVGAVALTATGGLSYLRQTPLVAALFVLPGILTGGAMVVLHAPIRPRFFFMMAGFALLVVVRGASCLGEWLEQRLAWRRPGTVAVGLVAAMAVFSVWSLGFNYRFPKQDFAGALEYVNQHRQPADVVATAGLAVYPFERYYGLEWLPLRTGDEFAQVRAQSARAWVVYSFPVYMDPALVESLGVQCPVRQVFPGTLGGGDVLVCSTAP